MNKITDDYCASTGENTASLYPIGGRIPLKHQYLFDLNDDSSINMVNVYARPDTGQYTLIALSNTDNKLTFYTINMAKTTLTAYKQVNLHAQSTLTIKPLVITHPHTNLVISHNETETGQATLYLINKNYLYKIGLVDCGQHGQSCDKCTTYDECGWCAATKTCGYRSECPLATCENENEVNSIVYDPNARNKTIVFEFVSRLTSVSYRCVFGTQCDMTMTCLDVDVVPLDPHKIMCPLPSNLDRLIDSNDSKR
jgi:hypothetical protein